MSQRNIFTVDAGPQSFTRDDCDDERMVYDLQKFVDFIRAHVALDRVRAVSPPVSIDTETTGLWPHRGHRIFSLQFYHPTWQHPWILDLRFHDREKALLAVQDVIDLLPGALFQNAKFDLKMLIADGIKIPHGWIIDDTMLLAFCIDENRMVNGTLPRSVRKSLSLDFLCRYYEAPDDVQKNQNVVLDWLQSRGLGMGDMIHVPPSLNAEYGCQDVIATSWLWDRLITDQGLASGSMGYDIERPLPLVLAGMELRGHAVDCEFLETAEARLADRCQRAEMKARKLLGRSLAIGKDVDVYERLIDAGCAWPEWAVTEKGNISVDHDTLAALNHPAAEVVMVWREADKLLNTYVRPWLYEHQADGIIYGNFNQVGARTARFSAEHPNLQNVPRRSKLGKYIRQAFVCRDGFRLWYFDYSQIEYRFFAHYSGHPVLIDGYLNDPSFDIHQTVADLLDLDRDEGKTINFGTLYGMGAEKFAKSLQRTVVEAQRFLDDYARRFNVRTLKDRIRRAIHSKGRLMDLFGGFQRFIGRNEHAFLNYLIQGTAARAFKAKMPGADQAVRALGGNTLVQIHDELGAELPVEADVNDAWKVKESMEFEAGEYDIKVPIRVDVERSSTTWAAKEEVTV